MNTPNNQMVEAAGDTPDKNMEAAYDRKMGTYQSLSMPEPAPGRPQTTTVPFRNLRAVK